MGRLRRPDLILASASPRRRAILRAAGMSFRVDPSHIDENIPEKNPRRLVAKLARAKALEVARRHPGDFILGADTIVVCAGEILGKPKDVDDAMRMLALQAGRWQRVMTGVALVRGRSIHADVCVTKVRLRPIDDTRLRALARKHLDKAGGYAAQDRDDPFIELIVGERDNVVGLPMKTVKRLLKRARQAK